MTDPEDREQQADITRRLLYFLNAPIVDHSVCVVSCPHPAPYA
ncbi:hypothetical protein [Streptomyces sp. NPDC060187]